MIYTITSPPYDYHGQMGFCHISAPPTSLVDLGYRPGPPVKHAWGLPAIDKHCPLQASGSGGLRRLARRDVAAGTHVHLIVCTRVWNPSHHCLT
jgi:hypothetical protein